jgi:dimethylamine--corrinoid protein Co-methyltransferase
MNKYSPWTNFESKNRSQRQRRHASYDASPLKIIRSAVNVHRIQSLQIYEKLLGADTLELGHVDYSFKPVKPIVGTEQTVLEQTLMVTHPPLFYGAMPNIGLYSQTESVCL